MCWWNSTSQHKTVDKHTNNQNFNHTTFTTTDNKTSAITWVVIPHSNKSINHERQDGSNQYSLCICCVQMTKHLIKFNFNYILD